MNLSEAIRRYLIWRQASGTTLHTVQCLRYVLGCFSRWAEDQGVAALSEKRAFLPMTIEQLTPDLFLAYQQELPFRLTPRGRPISISTQLHDLSVLRSFGRYLVEQDFLMSDPARRLVFPRHPCVLPKMIPDVKQAVLLMGSATATATNGTGLSDIAGVTCNRAVLELLYGTGLRRSEASNLNVGDLDLVGGYVWVRQGKGKKDRVVPLGQMAITALTVYLDAVRPTLIKDKDEGALFLNRFGGRLLGGGIFEVVKKAVASARLSPKITPHSLRHAAATHMLQNGAPIRHIQEFLGHASLETTQVYTRVTIIDLKAVHAKYHPREKEGY